MVTYEKEFKEQAVKMAAEVGEAKTAKDLGVHVNTLYTWISPYVMLEMLRQSYSEDLTISEIFDIALDAGRNDWFHLNSMSYDNGFLILSGRNQDMVVKINYNTEEVVWILTDPSNTLPDELSKKLLKPIGPNFSYSYGQHAVIYKNNILTLYDNGNHRSKDPYNVIDILDNYSRGVSYHIDEKNMTVSQIWEFGKSESYQTFTPYIGDIDVLGQDHYLINFGGLISINGVQTADTFAAFFGTADSYARVVEIKDNRVIMNVLISGDGYANIYRASKENIYQNQKELSFN